MTTLLPSSNSASRSSSECCSTDFSWCCNICFLFGESYPRNEAGWLSLGIMTKEHVTHHLLIHLWSHRAPSNLPSLAFLSLGAEPLLIYRLVSQSQNLQKFPYLILPSTMHSTQVSTFSAEYSHLCEVGFLIPVLAFYALAKVLRVFYELQFCT